MTDYCFLDSITDACAELHRGLIGVSGSHGGLYPASLASRAGLRSVVFNDAGKGLEDAGVAGIALLDKVRLAAFAAAADSAEIGSARETLHHGVVSFVNQTAVALGVESGMSVESALSLCAKATQPVTRLAAAEEARFERELGGRLKILCVDSASLISKEDAGRVIVTGSHGGLISGDPQRACKALARLVSFNDAGGGKNAIGFSRLPALDAQEVAAITLDSGTCRIGDAASSLDDGVVSKANQSAQLLGFQCGQKLTDALALL